MKDGKKLFALEERVHERLCRIFEKAAAHFEAPRDHLYMLAEHHRDFATLYRNFAKLDQKIIEPPQTYPALDEAMGELNIAKRRNVALRAVFIGAAVVEGGMRAGFALKNPVLALKARRRLPA